MKRINYMILIGIIVTFMAIIIKFNNGENLKQESLESIIEIEKTVVEIENSDSLELIENFIKNINTSTEIVLLEEIGEYNLSYSKYSSKWNKWLTTNVINMFIDYTAIVTVPTNSILLTSVGDTVYVTYNINSFTVKSVEVTEKTITEDRDIFASSYSNEEKIALEKIAVEKIRTNTLSDSNILKSKEVLENYLIDFANKCGVHLVFK